MAKRSMPFSRRIECINSNSSAASSIGQTPPSPKRGRGRPEKDPFIYNFIPRTITATTTLPTALPTKTIATAATALATISTSSHIATRKTRTRAKARTIQTTGRRAVATTKTASNRRTSNSPLQQRQQQKRKLLQQQRKRQQDEEQREERETHIQPSSLAAMPRSTTGLATATTTTTKTHASNRRTSNSSPQQKQQQQQKLQQLRKRQDEDQRKERESIADIICTATKNATSNSQNAPETSEISSENAKETATQPAAEEQVSSICHFEHVPESESASFCVQFADEARTEMTIRKRKLSTKEQENVEETKTKNAERKAPEKEGQLRAEGIKTALRSQQKQRLPSNTLLPMAFTSASSAQRKLKPKLAAKPKPIRAPSSTTV